MESSHNAPIIHAFNLAQKKIFFNQLTAKNLFRTGLHVYHYDKFCLFVASERMDGLSNRQMTFVTNSKTDKKCFKQKALSLKGTDCQKKLIFS